MYTFYLLFIPIYEYLAEYKTPLKQVKLPQAVKVNLQFSLLFILIYEYLAQELSGA